MARLFVPATLFAGYPRWVWIAAVLVLVLATAYVVAELVARLLRLGARTLLGVRLERDERGTLGPALRLARGVVFLLVALALTFPGLKLAGVETTVGLRPEALGRWLMVSGLRIVLIVLVSTLLLRFTAALSRRFEEEVAATGGTDAAERLRRVRTLGTIARNTAGVLVTGIALLMVLRELNLDITPILTGAGIAGLAVGFGAQSLVKDVISGFFMILENQVRVGDVASINGTGGLVEAITLRTIVLRDVNGTVHVFPNGSITTLSNMSKDFAYAVLDIALAYDEDPDRVTAILRGIDEEIRADAAYK
ncbi:MAG TPA: mechanosensitive ion channel domain-containing protein, partial [Vicinamibacterales bacterium]